MSSTFRAQCSSEIFSRSLYIYLSVYMRKLTVTYSSTIALATPLIMSPSVVPAFDLTIGSARSSINLYTKSQTATSLDDQILVPPDRKHQRSLPGHVLGVDFCARADQHLRYPQVPSFRRPVQSCLAYLLESCTSGTGSHALARSGRSFMIAARRVESLRFTKRKYCASFGSSS